jgi:hypothetical protein
VEEFLAYDRFVLRVTRFAVLVVAMLAASVSGGASAAHVTTAAHVSSKTASCPKPPPQIR